jgi:putrescine transport system permease protein
VAPTRHARTRSWIGVIPWAWVLAFFVVPFALILGVSVSTPELAVPPYALPAQGIDPSSYARLGGELATLGDEGADHQYLSAWISALLLAALTTVTCLLIGYPFAYHIARSQPGLRETLLMLVMLPFWTAFLLRVFAWKGLLDSSEVGVINQVLLGLGLISTPWPLLYNAGAVAVGMVYSYLPFMVLPLYAHLVKLDGRLLEAARDLGATPMRAFVQVTLPLSVRGIVAGCMLVFIPAVGEFVIPDLLGGGNVSTIGRRIWEDFGPNQDWPMAAAVAVVMLVVLMVPIAILNRSGGGGKQL